MWSRNAREQQGNNTDPSNNRGVDGSGVFCVDRAKGICGEFGENYGVIGLAVKMGTRTELTLQSRKVSLTFAFIYLLSYK
jgi:hypothetical protein